MKKTPVVQRERDSQDHLCRQILDALKGIRYGAVEIIVHDSRIVQIERREKLRVEPLDASGTA